MTTNVYDALAGRYLPYKEGTEKLITWLAETASECTNLSLLVSSLNTVERVRRAVSGGTVELRVAELVPLAEAIVNSKTVVTIPAWVLATTRRVIVERRKCADTYAAKFIRETRTISEKDRSYQYFIGVLEQVLDTLRSTTAPPVFFEPTRTAKKAVQVEKPADVHLSNKFGGLEVQELDTSAAEATVATEKSPQIDFSKATFSIEKGDQYTTFALWCHLEDMADVRSFVEDIWSQYLRGDVSFILASMVTDASICLFKCSDDAFIALNPLLATHDAVVKFLGLKILNIEDDGGPAVVDATSGVALIPLPGTPDIADLLCLEGAGALRLHNLKSWQMTIGNSAERVLPSNGLANEFLLVLLGYTMAIYAAKEGVSGIDVYTQAMGDPATHNRMWLVNATQMYIHLFRNLGKNNSDGVPTLIKAFKHTSLITEARQKHYRSFPANGGESICKWLRLVSTQLQAANEILDIETPALDAGNMQAPDYKSERKQKLKLPGNPWISGFEKKLPTHAGSCLYTLKTVLMLRGCQTCNEDMVVHSMAYLYKAARHTGLLASAWLEMDFFIASQASVGPLVPHFKVKAKLNNIFVAFQKAVGGVFKTKAAKRRDESVTFDLERGTTIKIGAPLTAGLLENLGSLENVSTSRSRVMSAKIVEVMLHRLTAAEAGPKQKGKSPMLRTMFTPLELLTTFKSTFQREEPLLNFDYFEFWMKCVKISRTIHDVIPSKQGETRRPVQMAHEILREVVGLQDGAEGLAGSKLAKAAAAMQSYMSESGGVLLRDAGEQSTGTIPKHLRPVNTVKA